MQSLCRLYVLIAYEGAMDAPVETKCSVVVT